MAHAARERGLGPSPDRARAIPPAGLGRAEFGSRATLTRLQRVAGNRAVTRLVEGSGRRRGQATHPGSDAEHPSPGLRRHVLLQRHSSWEHVLLGDTQPSRLGEAMITPEARKHVLVQESQRMSFFWLRPDMDPREKFPDVRWVQLEASGLWVSYGELNALSDYLPNPTAADTMTQAELVPVLQRMRSGVKARTGEWLGLGSSGREMHGMARSWLDWVNEAAGDVKALDTATESRGTERYAGLVARNACHFAPFSWQRWAHHHTEARAAALAHHQSRTDPEPIKDVPKEAPKQLRQAWLTNGYGDHFLQDSFAAGHLANKTLVMQWWLDYLNERFPLARDQHVARGHRGSDRPSDPWLVGMPDDDVRERMGSREQPGMAGRGLYDTPITSVGYASGDRELGDTVTDPQTAQERTDYERRVAGSGVDDIGLPGEQPTEARHHNYQAYLRFLNSAVLQAGAGAAHDYLNEHGLKVTNKRGDAFWIGGDDTLLMNSGPLGAELAGEASRMSRQSIEDLLDTGETAITPEAIFELVPSSVMVENEQGESREVGLEDWQDEVLHDLCVRIVFPELLKSIKLQVIGNVSPELIEGGGVSEDVGQEPPRPAMGDYPVPSGSSVPA